MSKGCGEGVNGTSESLWDDPSDCRTFEEAYEALPHRIGEHTRHTLTVADGLKDTKGNLEGNLKEP